MQPPTLDVDPYDAELLAAPADYHRALRELAPVVTIPRYGAVAVGRINEVERVFRDWRTFSSARGVGLADFAREPPWRPPSIVLEVDPPAHDRTRQVLARALSPQAVQQWRPRMLATAEQVVDAALARGTVDAAHDLAQTYPLAAFGDAVGLGADDRTHLLRYGAMVFNALGPDNLQRRRALAAAADVVPWITAQCARARLADDGFGAAIYAAAEKGDITCDEASLLVRSLLSAGIDTTVATLGFLLDCLARHPVEWARLRADATLIPAAIDETLRYACPVHTFCRTTTVATDIGGIAIPAATKVLCVMAAANRDPRRWDRPDEFTVERPRLPHVAFGSGIHVCVGQHVARQEIGILLEVLLARVRSIAPTGPAVIEHGNAVNTLVSLPLVLVAA
jgi:4-methoxybenzoate monooxygenase (O-demethylating)